MKATLSSVSGEVPPDWKMILGRSFFQKQKKPIQLLNPSREEGKKEVRRLRSDRKRLFKKGKRPRGVHVAKGASQRL